MKNLQVTIGAGVTQVTTSDIPFRQAMFQNNSGHVMRIGDATTTASIGAQLASGSPGGSMNVGPFIDHADNLKNYFVAGTQNDVLDILYIP